MMLQFSDQNVPYERFLNDLAERVAEAIKPSPEYICQNEAFRQFGRANIERWRKQGKIEPCKRPGKLEYRIVELKKLQATKQDYFL